MSTVGDHRFRADKNGTQYWSDTENHCALPGCTSAVIITTVQAGLLGRGKTFTAPLPWSWDTASLPETTVLAPLQDNANGELVTRTITYTYDALNRLTAADYSTGEQYGYQYDAVGNRTVYTLTTPLDGTAVTTYTYDAANRLQVTVSPGHLVTYTWDNRGNLLADGTFTYTYSAAGRMVRAESITATLVYTYNADGLRVAQAQSVSSVQSVDTFTWDWATGVPELLSDGESLYLIGYDTLGWQNGDDWTFVLPDALGSVRQETDAAGAVTAVREWSPYGEELGGAQTGLGFTGEWYDANVGLTYLRARWYDGTMGRFTSQDLWKGDNSRPQSLNGWIYVVGNPVNLTDPSGLMPKCNGPFPKCFIVYITGIGEGLRGAGQEEFLSRISSVEIESLDATDSPVIRIKDPIPYASNKIEAALQVVLAANSTSDSEIALAQTIDSELSNKGARPCDEVNIIAWSGGAQLGVGAASQMQHYVNHAVLLGGAFRADEGLANIGLTYDLFGDQEPRYRKPVGGPDNVVYGTLTYDWDLFNHGKILESRIAPFRGPYGEPIMIQEYVYHPTLDLYKSGKIIHIPVPGSDHFGYFAEGAADVIIRTQTRVCKRYPYLPIILRN